MVIPPEVRACWDQETVYQVELALKSLPEDLHPAVWYVGGHIADLRASMDISPGVDGIDITNLLMDFGIDPDDMHEASVNFHLEKPKMLNSFIGILDALRQGCYGVVHIFFQEKLRILRQAVSLTVAPVYDFEKASSYLTRNQPELDLLENIVSTLSQHISAPPQ